MGRRLYPAIRHAIARAEALRKLALAHSKTVDILLALNQERVELHRGYEVCHKQSADALVVAETLGQRIAEVTRQLLKDR